MEFVEDQPKEPRNIQRKNKSKSLKRNLENSEEQDQAETIIFSCQNHSNEEYQYYDAVRRKLFCPQCLLMEPRESDFRQIKPLKRCFPELL